jgi:hypothetical protein
MAMKEAALLAGTVVLAAAVLVWTVVNALRPRCYLCRFRRPRFSLGDYPLCQDCWEKLEGLRAIEEGIESDTADMEIRQYRINHPGAKP